MDSGSDSNKSQEYPQWALNPSAYQNLANNQVDWAALAQQWITMKEAGIPPIGSSHSVDINEKPGGKRQKEDNSAKEMHKIEAPAPPVWGDPSVPPPGSEYWSQDKSWSWSNMPSNTWLQSNDPPPPKTIGLSKPSLLPTPNNYIPPASSDNGAQFNNYNSFNSDTSVSNNYWDSSGNANKHIKPHNKRYSKVNVPVRAPAVGMQPMAAVPVPDIPAAPILDSAKRKQLPAWIKEGLEKMEKDKLKQMEKDKQKKQREEIVDKSRSRNKESIEILKNTLKEKQKSKFDSDSEHSDDATVTRTRSPSPIAVPPEELMLKIRRTMTDLLLKVTDVQIEQICKEELLRYAKKKVKDPPGRSKYPKSRFSRHGSSETSSSRSRSSSSPRPD